MLVTVDEIKNYLDISSNTRTTSDANLTSLASYASAVIESYCGRDFSAATVVEYHNGGRSSVFVQRLPVNNVHSITEYDGNKYEPLKSNAEGLPDTNAEVVWDEHTGQFSRSVHSYPQLGFEHPRTFKSYKKGVRIEYNGGYDNIPNDIKLAALDYIKILYKQDQSSFKQTFQGESKEARPLSGNMPAHVRRVLDLYRLYTH